MKIIIDAFGGDHAPLEIIKGAVDAKKEYGVEILLTGDEKAIRGVAMANGVDIDGIEIVHAPDVITMEDEANAVLKEKPQSSMAVGLQLLASGKGDGFVSAGNSGALCVGATLIVKRIKGIKRPGFAPVMPHFGNGCFMLCDGGANLECRPEMLKQYALMGSVYMEKVMGIGNPRVGLANVGTEPHKGTELQHQVYGLLEESGLNFIGNVEGREVPFGACDVLVCDGFTGNLILKTYEGVAKALMGEIKHLFTKSLKNKLAAGLVYSDLQKMKTQFDYNEYGGAPIMGTLKPVFKAHGSAKAKTVRNAIRLTKEYIEADVINEIASSL